MAMNKAATETCPCRISSEDILSYADCCLPLHNGRQNACKSAESLMRSRYSAFVLHLEDYLLETWHPSTRPANLSLDGDICYLSLNIMYTDQNHVQFCAMGRDKNGFFTLQEMSTFVWENNRCFYLNGETKVQKYAPSRNDPCPCGSGKKFKKCCLQMR